MGQVIKVKKEVVVGVPV